MIRTLSSLLLLSSLSFAESTYRLSYSPDTNCALVKNGVDIPLFDPRFERKMPSDSYTCSAIQKEQYNDCKVVAKQNITAQFFGYGVYEHTNLIIAIKTPHKTVKSFLEIECTKELHKNK